MFITDIFESVQRMKDYYQTILILNRINILAIEFEADFYQCIYVVNQMNELCNEYKQAIHENKLKLYSINVMMSNHQLNLKHKSLIF